MTSGAAIRPAVKGDDFFFFESTIALPMEDFSIGRQGLSIGCYEFLENENKALVLRIMAFALE